MYIDRTMKDCWIEAGKQFPVLLTGPRQVVRVELHQIDSVVVRSMLNA